MHIKYDRARYRYIQMMHPLRLGHSAAANTLIRCIFYSAFPFPQNEKRAWRFSKNNVGAAASLLLHCLTLSTILYNREGAMVWKAKANHGNGKRIMAMESESWQWKANHGNGKRIMAMESESWQWKGIMAMESESWQWKANHSNGGQPISVSLQSCCCIFCNG